MSVPSSCVPCLHFKSSSEQDQNIIKFISQSSQLVIFERALEIIRERDNEDEDPISSLGKQQNLARLISIPQKLITYLFEFPPLNENNRRAESLTGYLL